MPILIVIKIIPLFILSFFFISFSLTLERRLEEIAGKAVVVAVVMEALECGTLYFIM